MLRYWTIAVVVAAGQAAAQAPRAAKPEAKAIEQGLREKVRQLAGEAPKAGMTVAIAPADGAVLSASAGPADRERGIALKPDDRMLAGSTGKTFVSAVMLLAVEEGRLALDDPLRKWLGGEKWFGRLPNANELTLRMLMNHSSGIPEHVLDPAFIAALHAEPDRTWKPAELIAYVLDKPALFPAGRGWSYADTNYILAAMAYEKATGRFYYDELRRRILGALGLSHTAPSDRRTLEGLIPGYSGPRSPFRIEGRTMRSDGVFPNPQCEWTGGGVVSTPGDLARWAKLLYEGKVLAASSMRELLDGVDASHGRGGGKDERYGLAVQIRPSDWGITYGHDGWFPGYLTTMLYFAERRTAIAVQVNTDNQRDLAMPLAGVANAVAAWLFNEQ